MPSRFILSALLLGTAINAGAATAPVTVISAPCAVVNLRPQFNDRYEWQGACKDGLADGPGVLQWYLKDQESERYEGQMAHGLPEGKGAYEYADKMVFQGTFKDGLRSGAGVMIYPDDSLLFATFVQDAITGPVKRRYKLGDVYEGGWGSKGPQGMGTTTYAVGGSYTGQWAGDKPMGEGVITYPNGAVVKGRFNGSFQLGAALVAAAPGGYVLKNEARTGSHIKREVATNFPVPPAKSYAELTREEQGNVKSHYVYLQENDEPPYPLKGYEAVSQPVVDGNRHLYLKGDLTLLAQVGADGKVSSVSVLKSPAQEMTDFASKVLLITPFKPAICAGQACAMGMYFAFYFTQE